MKRHSQKTIYYFALLLVLPFLTYSKGWAATIYVDSKNGDDLHQGTIVSPVKTVSKALSLAGPGDFLKLMPGTHKGVITIAKSGDQDKPITIMSYSDNPDQFAVIDSGATVNDSNKFGFKLQNCKWITIENLKFRNCWKEIIEVDNSNYIVIRGNDFKEGRRVVRPYGINSHHILVENNYWEQDKRIWTTWDWATMHDEYIYNGALYGTKEGEQGPGAAVIRNNHLKYVFNGIWLRSAALNRQANNEIYGNLMEYVRDNAVEPEDYTFNLHVYHNKFNQVSNGVFSIQGASGGPIFIYGNVGFADSNNPPFQSGTRGIPNWRIFKMSNSDDNKLTDTLHTYHNTWYYGLLTNDSGKTNRHWHHYNNIGVFSNGYQLVNYQYDSWDNDFDYDYSNKPWPGSVVNYGEEQNGIANAGAPSLTDPSNGDYRINGDARLIDKGRIIPEFTQSFQGSAPDLGAYEGNQLVEGPPFYIQVPSGGLGYVEKPRITRHRINNKTLTLFWSWPIDPSSISRDSIILTANGVHLSISYVRMGSNNRETILETNEVLAGKQLSITFSTYPYGSNGEKATLWANTLEGNTSSIYSYVKLDPPQNLRILVQ